MAGVNDDDEHRSISGKLSISKEELQSINEEAQAASDLKGKLRLIDLSRHPIFVWEFDGGILEWNRGSEELYGYSAAEAAGKVKNEPLQTKGPGSSFEELKAALLRDGFWSGELQQRAKDGRVVTVDSRIHLERVDGRRLALESTRDIGERKLWEQRQQLLLRELTHRVKNTLAIVQSIANRTLRNTREGFVERFSGRLAALSAAHDILVRSDWQGADFEAMARAQLLPHASDNPEHLHIDGEAVLLPADISTPFGLALHELAANAAKYGALSVDYGKIDLRWEVGGHDSECLLTVVWQARNGPPPKRNAKAGFGSTLIDNSIPNATVRREFARDGFACTIIVPLAQAVVEQAFRTEPPRP